MNQVSLPNHLSTDRKATGIARQGLLLHPMAGPIDFSLLRGTKRANPPARRLFRNPRRCSERINPEHAMHMLAHDGVSIGADGKALCKDLPVTPTFTGP
jgi:hypothetical protein